MSSDLHRYFRAMVTLTTVPCIFPSGDGMSFTLTCTGILSAGDDSNAVVSSCNFPAALQVCVSMKRVSV